MNDNLAQLKNDQQPSSLLTEKGQDDQDILQQTSNSNASGATAPPSTTTTTKVTLQYAPPPPLDEDTDFHPGVVTEGLTSRQESSAAVEHFGSTAATSAATTTSVVDYNYNPESHDATAPFSNIPVDHRNSAGIISQPALMNLHEQRHLLRQQQQQQQQHKIEGSSSHHPDIEGAMLPSQSEHQQHQMPYNEINDESNSSRKKEAYHGFVSSAAVPESEEYNQQDLQYSPPPPNLPPLTTLPSPPPPPLDNNQYAQDSHHPCHDYFLHQQQSQQQQLHSIHSQEQAMNAPNHVHQQPPPLPPIAHHSPYDHAPPYPHHHQNQHPHYYQQHHQQQQQCPSYHNHQQPPPSNHHPGFNTDRPTYLFSLPTTDSQSLSDRQCYIRSTFIELFLATAEDVASRPTKGYQKIHEGQIGIRCAYCVDNTNDAKQRLLQELQHPRVERAVCFPQSISRIYQTVADMQRRHFEKCARIPVQVMGTYKSLKSTRPRGKGNPQEYWESSAREIGLVDSGEKGIGIRVRRDGEGRLVEQFLRQRKVEEIGGAGGVVERHVNESTAAGAGAAAAQVGGGDYDKKPSAKRSRSVDKEETASRKRGHSSQADVDQDKTSSVMVNKIIEPPPVPSYSDAHLLASMRDRASPSFPVVKLGGMTNNRDGSQDVHPQMNENDPVTQHGGLNSDLPTRRKDVDLQEDGAK